MNPVRVTPPTAPVVTLGDMKDHLRVNHDDQDLMIQSLTDAAVSHLDGWRGVLGRCIMPQTWSVSFRRAGCFDLPFPDIQTVTGGTWDGCRVTLTEPGPVGFTCALPEDALPAVQDAVKIWVQMRYDNLSGPDRVAAEAAFTSLIDPLRWGWSEVLATA